MASSSSSASPSPSYNHSSRNSCVAASKLCSIEKYVSKLGNICKSEYRPTSYELFYLPANACWTFERFVPKVQHAFGLFCNALAHSSVPDLADNGHQPSIVICAKVTLFMFQLISIEIYVKVMADLHHPHLLKHSK